MFQPGSHIDRYVIQRRIGRGGMGAVYAAQDPLLGRMVAIKVFEGDIEAIDGRERFSREARAAAALSHPGIVTVFDFGECDSQPYIVMEWVTGETLAAVIRRRAEVSLADKLRWAEEVCAAASYAHRRSVVHRDIKPANLMLDASDRLRILDFGIARMLGSASTTQSIVGTPGYMAPEQIEGGAVDHRADIFAIGVVLYELLAYKEAFPGDTAVAITHRILTQEPQPLADLVPSLDAAVVDICTRALHKAPDRRFQQADEMRSALARVRDSLTASETLLITAQFPAADASGHPADTGPERQARPPQHPPESRTPTPAPRRTDREALARRRGEWLKASIDEARARLAAGALDEALESCQRALTFDETHAEALELEQQILSAMERAVGDTATRHDGPAPGPPAAPADADHTVMVRVRQTDSLAPAAYGGMPAAAAVQVLSPGADATTGKAVVPGPSRATRPQPARGRRVLRLGLLSAAAVAIVAAAAVMLIPSGPAPVGTLVVDAVPWGSVASIESIEGEPVTLPPDTSTPFILELPAGSYRVVMNSPPSTGRQDTLTVTVAENGTTVAPAVRFAPLSVEEYFESYLAGAVPAPAAPEVPGS